MAVIFVVPALLNTPPDKLLATFNTPVPDVFIGPEFVKPLGTVKLPLEFIFIVPVLLAEVRERLAVTLVVPPFVKVPVVRAFATFNTPVPLVVRVPDVLSKPLGTVKLPFEFILMVPPLLVTTSGESTAVTLVVPPFVKVPVVRAFATFNTPVPLVVKVPDVLLKPLGTVKLPLEFILMVPLLIELALGVKAALVVKVPVLVKIPVVLIEPVAPMVVVPLLVNVPPVPVRAALKVAVAPLSTVKLVVTPEMASLAIKVEPLAPKTRITGIPPIVPSVIKSLRVLASTLPSESLPINSWVPPNIFPEILPVLFGASPITYNAPVLVKLPGTV